MSQVIAAVREHALQRPDSIALDDGHQQISYRELADAIAALSARFQGMEVRTLGLYADNGLAWALTDLAALSAGIRIVPLPLFFSGQQLRNVVESAGIDGLIADPAMKLTWLTTARTSTTIKIAGQSLSFHRLPGSRVELPPGTQKITYTSGTTGTPKGVCLTLTAMESVAQSLREASMAGPDDCHLCVLPLPTLLENLAGLYAPLLAGAKVCLPAAAEVGLQGSSGFDPACCLAAMRTFGATSAILVPQLLQALIQGLDSGLPRPGKLRFIAVGGAPIASRILAAAERHGLPVFEGYGLSECASVVALNTLEQRRSGSVGRPLPHLRVRIAADGEVLVTGNAFLGYVGEKMRSTDDEVATGDVGYLDADGFLYLTGRRKNMFVTSFGRNVAPEWIERELTSQPAIAQAAVFGEARPWNIAVIVRRPGFDTDAIDRAIESCNRDLPDYAQIRHWLLAASPFTPENDQATANGRLRRSQIAERYRALIDHQYEEDTHDVVS